MFTEQTLSLILSKITEIQDLCKKQGLENLRIIKPESVDDWEKITILGDEKNKVLITPDFDFLEERVNTLLDCDVCIMTDSMLREHVKKRILGGAVPYTENSKASLTKLFNDELLPLAKRYQQNQQKNGNKKRNAFEFFQEKSSEESTPKKNKEEDKSADDLSLSREQLLANKLFEANAAEILSLSPPEKEEFIKHLCKSAGINIDNIPRPLQKV